MDEKGPKTSSDQKVSTFFDCVKLGWVIKMTILCKYYLTK